jgi:cytochrome c oxidase assembly protein subunit 15
VTISAARYRVIAYAALVALVAIVVTGAAVRLTGSGLGCDDWPGCNSQHFVDMSDKHTTVEQVNRLFTGVVSVAVIAAVLGSVFRTPRRRDLIWLSAGLVVGVVAQAVLGGITVLVDLHPVAVQGHMLLSLVLVGNAVVLVQRASEPDEGTLVRPVSPEISRHVLVIALATVVALVTGTVVTGAGPHAGDEEARRFGVEISSAARVHSITVLCAVALVVWLMWRLRRRDDERREVAELVSSWVFIALLQGAIGYIQYFNEIPALLVGIHVFGATMLWAVTVALVVRTQPLRRAAATNVAPAASRSLATAATNSAGA